MPTWLPQSPTRPRHLSPGRHYVDIRRISSSRNRQYGYLKVDLTVSGFTTDEGTVSIRVYDDTSKDFINRLTSSFLRTILSAADFPDDEEREPDWSEVCKALKGVTFALNLRSKDGGVPFLTGLKVFSDIRTGDHWGFGPEENERMRAFFLDDEDYL